MLRIRRTGVRAGTEGEDEDEEEGEDEGEGEDEDEDEEGTQASRIVRLQPPVATHFYAGTVGQFILLRQAISGRWS